MELPFNFSQMFWYRTHLVAVQEWAAANGELELARAVSAAMEVAVIEEDPYGDDDIALYWISFETATAVMKEMSKVFKKILDSSKLSNEYLGVASNAPLAQAFRSMPESYGHSFVHAITTPR